MKYYVNGREIKSGSIGRMKSMRMFMEKYQVPQGIKISQAPYDSGNKIISLPLYSLEGFIVHRLRRLP